MPLFSTPRTKGCVVIAGDALKFPKEALTRKSDLAFGSPDDDKKTIEHILSIADRIVPAHFTELILHDGTIHWEDTAEFILQIR